MPGRVLEDIICLFQIFRAENRIIEHMIPQQTLASVNFTLEGSVHVGIACSILIGFQLSFKPKKRF